MNGRASDQLSGQVFYFRVPFSKVFKSVLFEGVFSNVYRRVL